MPKVPKSKAETISDLLSKNIGKGVFRRDGNYVFCRVCIKRLGAVTKYTLTTHLNTSQHKNMASRSTQLQNQLNGDTNNNPEEVSQGRFIRDLIGTMVRCDIPLFKLNNEHFRKIFAKYSNFSAPSEAHARQNIIPELFNETISKIKQSLQGKKIWVSVDEARDSDGRFIAAIVVRALSETGGEPPILLNLTELTQTDGESIMKAVDDALRLVSDVVDREDVVMLTTDGAPYMIRSGECYKINHTAF